MTHNQVVDKLMEELSYTQILLRGFRKQVIDRTTSDLYRTRLMEVIIPDTEADERELIRKLVTLEGCEHTDAEDTGGPDGSQRCSECGRVL